MEQAIQFTLGVAYLVIGLSCLIHTKEWTKWMEKLRKDAQRSSIVMGSVGLMVSAFIVGGHNVWTGLPLLVTLIGVIGIVEGAIYLLFPRALPFVLFFFTVKNIKIFRALSLLSILLGGVILYIWICGCN